MSGGRDERSAAGTEGARNPEGGLAAGQSPRPSGLEARPPRGQSRHNCPPPGRACQGGSRAKCGSAEGQSLYHGEQRAAPIATESKVGQMGCRCRKGTRCGLRSIPQAAIECTATDGSQSAAYHVRIRRDFVRLSYVELLRDLDSRCRLQCRSSAPCFRSSSVRAAAGPGGADSWVDQSGLRASQRVCAKIRWIKTDAGHPLLKGPRVLPRPEPPLSPRPAKRN